MTGRNRTVITSITSSDDLAVVLNAQPLTEEDAAETPRDWLAGIWVAGETYTLDSEVTTETLAVLADGTAAVALSPKGEFCGRGHPYESYTSQSEHWCPADTDSWSWNDARGVERDWRSVQVWDANGFSETTVHPTVDAAKAAFEREVEEMGRMSKELDAEEAPYREAEEDARSAAAWFQQYYV